MYHLMIAAAFLSSALLVVHATLLLCCVRLAAQLGKHLLNKVEETLGAISVMEAKAKQADEAIEKLKVCFVVFAVVCQCFVTA